VTTLTKRLAEDLSFYMIEQGLRCKYLHSDIQTFDRVEILRELREGGFDCLIGVNLLREGLDLPEVSMVAILDADKEGFLRSETSLIQMIGRCARNVDAQVYLYADKITPAMQAAMSETTRRRKVQEEYNRVNNITPQTIVKAIRHGIDMELKARRTARDLITRSETVYDQTEMIRMLEEEMLQAASNLEFEKAAEIRDRLQQLKQTQPVNEQEPTMDLTTAIAEGMAQRLAGGGKPMTPQQTKVKRGGAKRNRRGPA
jgi:excinuclease ABC subunit B